MAVENQISSRYLSKTPCRAQSLQKEMRSLHTLIRTTNTFIDPQYRVLLVSKFSKLSALSCNYKYRVGGVLVSVLASSVVDHWFEPWSGYTKD
jgi:hypothetical protein